MATAYICSNNPEHVFSERTADFYCPTCSIEDKSILFIRDEGDMKNKLSPDIETDQLVSEDNNLENKGPINNEEIHIQSPINIPVEALEPDGEILDKIEVEEIIPEVVVTDVMKIGNQNWMLQYLKLTTFSNGEKLCLAQSPEDWKEAQVLKKPVYCFPNDDQELGSSLGLLYNWYAVSDSRGLAPKNWRIPSDMDWESLIQNQGGDQIATTKLKSKENWLNNNGGNNSSGLSIIPSGLRYDNGSFGFIQTYGIYWSSTSKDNLNAYYRYIDYPQGKISKMAHDKSHGFAVRCIQDINSNQPVISVNTTQNTDTIYT